MKLSRNIDILFEKIMSIIYLNCVPALVHRQMTNDEMKYNKDNLILKKATFNELKKALYTVDWVIVDNFSKSLFYNNIWDNPLSLDNYKFSRNKIHASTYIINGEIYLLSGWGLYKADKEIKKIRESIKNGTNFNQRLRKEKLLSLK